MVAKATKHGICSFSVVVIASIFLGIRRVGGIRLPPVPENRKSPS